MFKVVEIINEYIKNNIKPINTTSLSHSISYVVKWQHTSAFSLFSMINTIQHFFQKNKQTLQFYKKYYNITVQLIANKKESRTDFLFYYII